VTGAPLLSLQGVSKRFGGLTAVSDLSFDLKAGEILALIGPNGAGKSTTFNLIAGVFAPTTGTIALEGERIDRLPPHRIAARGIMRTFQHNMPFGGMSLIENILVGRHTHLTRNVLKILAGGAQVRAEEEAARKRAVELVRFVGLEDRIDANVATLSFGQGRLLEVARALAGEPRIILLDEPAAGLTQSEMVQLSAVIREIARMGIAILLIEHDMRFLLPLAERVVVLNFGRKIAEAETDEITKDPEVIKAYLGDTVVRRPATRAHA
jgi:ABC-type branched-subunit amino acid transport system ATPase component